MTVSVTNFEAERLRLSAIAARILGSSAGVVKVPFVFHAEAGLINEVELIADPDVLATMDVTRLPR